MSYREADVANPARASLAALVSTPGREQPDRKALYAVDRDPLTYRVLSRQVAATSEALASMGIGRRDRVALVLPNGPEMAVALIAVACTAICAPLNPTYTARELDFYLTDLEPVAIVVASELISPARDAATAHRVPIIELSHTASASAGVFTLSGECNRPHARTAAPQPDDVALVLHTSGTTARPKLVPVTHASLCTSGHSVAGTLQLRPQDLCLNVMPLFHVHGLVGALISSLTAGAGVVCTPGFRAGDMLPWIREFQPTWYTAVPTMHQAVLAAAAACDPPVPTTLRVIRSSSAPLAPQHAADLERMFGVPVVEAYGMTEGAHQISSNPLPPRERRSGTVGVATGCDVAILNEDRLLRPGTVGEIVIQGPNVTRGYVDNAAANAEAFVDGWFRTGDLGALDADGYLRIVGRLKEVINRGGEKISPREVDEALLEHPQVAQAVAFALPDPRLGEDVAAAVVLRTGAETTESELRRFVGERLARFKVPRHVVVLDKIPTGPTGKLQRIGLAARLGLGGGRE